MRSNFYFLLICLALITSCTFTTTKTREPILKDAAQLQGELNSLVKADNYNLNGKETTTNNKTTSELEVQIINGANVPSGEDQRSILAKSIGIAVKKNLKNPNEYETLKILFVSKREKNGVTTQTWVGNVFNSKEL